MITDDKFILLPPINYYKMYTAIAPNYIRNIKTGENMGQYVYLKVFLEDVDGNILEQPIYEEDCYEYVYVAL